jgi:SAM-dependent methyltransferase
MEQPQPTPPANPSIWVRRFAGEIRADGQVLDVAAGSGRHSRYLLELGFRVSAVDRDTSALKAAPGLEIVTADLEAGSGWPFRGRGFDGIVVTNYLHRPLFPALLAALAPGGLLIYETFQAGNAQFGRPSNPDFLLQPGELLDLAQANGLIVRGYFSGYTASPRPAQVQRLAAFLPE